MSTDKQVLAIKYRPQVFEELVGQKIIVEAIQKSISLDKIPNAFLFTGIRGVGKTTIARILAKSLNCSNTKKYDCLLSAIETRENFFYKEKPINFKRTPWPRSQDLKPLVSLPFVINILKRKKASKKNNG